MHREAGFSFRIYPHDHGPPHVHAVCGGAHSKIAIGDATTPPHILRAGRDAKDPDLFKALRIVEREWAAMLAAWRSVHGEEATH